MTLQIKALANNEAEILVYGEIGADWWGDGNDPKAFAKELQKIDATILKVRINSGGGDLFAGLAMYSALKQFKGKVITYIDGLAASAASIIAMAGNEVVMPANAVLMIHNASTMAYGDHNDFRKIADDIETSTGAMVATYVEKTGLSSDEVKSMMDIETYLSATEALAKGFIDRIDSEIQLNASINNEGKFVVNGINTALPSEKIAKISKLLAIKSNTANLARQSNILQGEIVMPLTLEAFKKDNPDIYEQIKASAYQDGIKTERERIKAIEDIETQGHSEICFKAKYETGISAPEVAMVIMRANKQQQQNYLANVQEDVNKVNQVAAASTIEAPHTDADSIPADFMASFTASANRKGVNHAK